MKDTQRKIEAHLQHMKNIIEVSYKVTSAMHSCKDQLLVRYLEELSGSVISIIEAQQSNFKDLHSEGLFDAKSFMEDNKKILKIYEDTVVNNRFRGRGIKEGFNSYLVTYASKGRAIWDKEWNKEAIENLDRVAGLVMSRTKQGI